MLIQKIDKSFKTQCINYYKDILKFCDSPNSREKILLDRLVELENYAAELEKELIEIQETRYNKSKFKPCALDPF